jgi:hypothetical protein
MVTVPFALSVHKFIDSVGNDVGFASIIAVAILILLYFAHARETATLRDRLDEAHSRIGGLEARIAQMLHAQASAQRGRVPAPVAPPPGMPAAARPPSSVSTSVRRVPRPATAAAGAASGGVGPATVASAAARPRSAGLAPSAPVGMAAPALASATRLIPAGEPGATGVREDTVVVSAATVAAAANGQASGSGQAPGVAPARSPAAAPGNGREPVEQTAPLTAATQAIPAVAAASARTPSASPKAAGGRVAPPPVKIGAQAATPATPAASARRSAANPRPASASLPPLDGPRRRSLSGRVLPLLIGGVAVVVIIVGLIVITNTGGSTTGNINHNTGNQTGADVSGKHHAPPPFKPAKFRVAVLNGTAVSGLAGDVGSKLAGQGYKKGNTTNASSQTETNTFVYYVTGKAAKVNKVAAQRVATALKLKPSRVHPATRSSIQSCSISATGTPLNSCNADVIVSVGSDRAYLASSGSAG